MSRSLKRADGPAGGNGWQSELPPSQLTLNFEPSLAERFGSLREYVAFRVQEQRLHAATLAGKMDLAPSTLSRKLNQPEGEAQRLNCDDLERYIGVTGDLMAVVEYLVAKFSPGGDDVRKARMLANAEKLLAELAPVLQALRGGGC